MTERNGAPSSTVGRGMKRETVLTCAIVTAAALVYSNTLENGFHLDDTHGIRDNVWVRSLRHVPRYFIDPHTLSTYPDQVDYRPLLQTTFALNYAISKYDPWSWHIVNFALHVVVAFGVLRLGLLLLGSRRWTEIPFVDRSLGDEVSSAAAILFSVHPLGAVCINYTWTRSTLLTAALGIHAVASFLEGLRRTQAGLGAGRKFSASMALYLAALLTKAEAVSVAGEVIVAALLLDPRLRGASLFRRLYRREFLRAALPFAALTIAYVFFREWIVPDFMIGIRRGPDNTPWSYFLTQLRAWWYYVGKLIAPVDLIGDYVSYPVSKSLLEPNVLLALAGWIGVGILLLRSLSPAPAIAFLGAWFFLALAPHSSLEPLFERVNEHRPYAPMIGVLLLALLGGRVVFARLWARSASIFWASLGVLCVVYGLVTFDRNKVWRDGVTFWQDVVSKDPASSRAHMNYGLALVGKRDEAEAEAHFREAVRLSASWNLAHINLGMSLHRQGRIEEALASIGRGIAIDPGDGRGYYYRGIVLARAGRFEGAVPDLERAATLLPQPRDAHVELAVLFARRGRDAESLATIRKLLHRHPTEWHAYYDAGLAAFETGQTDAARAIFDEAARNHPDEVAFHSNLGLARYRLGDFAGAAASYSSALSLDRDSPERHTNLAWALLGAGRLDEAKRIAVEALRRWPNDTPAKSVLSAVESRAQTLGR